MPLGNIFGLQFIVSQASGSLFDQACLVDENGDIILQEDGTSCITMENASGSVFTPDIEGIPVILGVTKVEETLTATSATIIGNPTPTISWQWERSADGSTGWSAISGATSSAYTLVEADGDQYIRVVQTATNTEGTDVETSVSTGQIETLLIQSIINSFVSRVEADGGTVENTTCLETELTFLTQN